jgi:hypothetical protein
VKGGGAPSTVRGGTSFLDLRIMFLRTPSCQVGSIAIMALEICAVSATVIASAGSRQNGSGKTVLGQLFKLTDYRIF